MSAILQYLNIIVFFPLVIAIYVCIAVMAAHEAANIRRK